MKEVKEKIFHCNVELTLDIIAGKWKALIIYQIGKFEKIRYGELKRVIPNINERVLSRQLRELEEDQLINRKVYDTVPPKVEYSLTDIGQSLSPILYELGEWGKEYNNKFEYGKINFDEKC